MENAAGTKVSAERMRVTQICTLGTHRPLPATVYLESPSRLYLCPELTLGSSLVMTKMSCTVQQTRLGRRSAQAG